MLDISISSLQLTICFNTQRQYHKEKIEDITLYIASVWIY